MTPKEKTKSCVRTLIEMIKLHGWSEDPSRIFGVKVIKNSLDTSREGMIVYGPSSPEACQAFVLGIDEISMSMDNGNPPISVECVNLKQLCRRVEYEDFLDDTQSVVQSANTAK
jgi:hypothetical protein